jgi:hypothetical protein
MKAKIKLQKKGTKVLMQVLEMDESLRSSGLIFYSKKGMSIRSSFMPEIRKSIWLRGSYNLDDNIISTAVGEGKYEKVLNAFKAWGTKLAKEETKNPSDLVLYKWAFESLMGCMNRSGCVGCPFEKRDYCKEDPYSKEELSLLYSKSKNKLKTTFKWIDKKEDIFEV